MRSVLVSALLLGSAVFGCGEFSPSERRTGERVVFGLLDPPTAVMLARQSVALSIAAVELDGREDPAIRDFRVGDAFSPAGNGGQPVRFRISLDQEQSYALFFQIPGEQSGSLGQLVARLQFAADASGTPTTLLGGRLPGTSDSAAPDLDLGIVSFTGGPPPQGTSPYAVNVAQPGEGTSQNPLALNDIDGDGIPDLDDPNDDNDSIPDEFDTDLNGDGVPDAEQSFDVLLRKDANENQIPDDLERP